ncbi:MAG TPA: ABC transporter substrate-binding protein [Acetobacteraceae bacterium]|nr:ABC transporter substrate-binding protein [Acetobacteraceae bacterium]
MITRRAALATGLGAGLGTVISGGLSRSRAANTPGVTATTIKIGNTAPYSGPASSYGIIGRTEGAVFKMVNDQGGVGGRKIDFISLDDSYSPPKTVEDTRRLVEQDQVDFMFQDIGTPCNSAIVEYLTHKKVPQLFVGSGASKWSDYKKYPWAMGWQPNYRTEAQIYTKYMLANVKDPKLGILYQNDDFGKDYPAGVRDILGKDWDKVVTKAASYETTDPTIDSQIVALQASGANVLLVAGIPKFAAQSIRKVHDLAWKPMFFMTNVSISVGGVMNPAGPENGVGILTTGYLKDPTDPEFENDPGMKQWRTDIKKYMPSADLTDQFIVFGYGVALTMVQVLKQCGTDFSRPNVMHQAESLHDVDIPVLLPGIRINTSPTDHRPIKQMQLMRWTGKTWERFGNLIAGV